MPLHHVLSVFLQCFSGSNNRLGYSKVGSSMGEGKEKEEKEGERKELVKQWINRINRVGLVEYLQKSLLARSTTSPTKGEKKKKARIVGQQQWTQSTFDLHSNSIKYVIFLLIIRQHVPLSISIFSSRISRRHPAMGHGRMIFSVVE